MNELPPVQMAATSLDYRPSCLSTADSGGVVSVSPEPGGLLYDGNGTSGQTTAASTVDQDLAVRLRALGHRVSPAEIADLWVFPPLPELEDSGDFVLFTWVLSKDVHRVCAVEFSETEPVSDGQAREIPTHRNGNGAAGNATSHRNVNGAGPALGNERRTVNGNGNGAEAPLAVGDDGDVHRVPGPVIRITEYGRVPSSRVQRVVDGFRRRLGDDREPLHIRINGCADSWIRLLATETSDG